MPGRRDLAQLGVPSVIAALQVAVPDVVQDLPPDGLGLPVTSASTRSMTSSAQVVA